MTDTLLAFEPETELAARIDAIAADPLRRAELSELLREEHPLYAQRGTGAIVRARGWILVAMARLGLSERELVFALEELESGTEPYLVAAAARALRSYPAPTEAFAPFVLRALRNIRYRDAPVSFEEYGGESASNGSSAVRELLATIAWLGPHARELAPELQSLRSSLGSRMHAEVDRALEAIGSGAECEACFTLPSAVTAAAKRLFGLRGDGGAPDAVVFEDQNGAPCTFQEVFRGRPSIVVFFYTRCDNPLKCSLTVSKLARVQRLLAERGLDGRIATAAITYDPEYDRPDRLRGYGESRGVQFAQHHRMLRAVEAFPALRAHFDLGVNFVQSLVNRHRIELYVLDADGEIAARFDRLAWNEEEVVAQAVATLDGGSTAAAACKAADDRPSRLLPAVGSFAAIAAALFPKCALCWSAYASVLGLTAIGGVPDATWLRALFLALVLVNLAGIWKRGRRTRQMTPFALAAAGLVALLAGQYAFTSSSPVTLAGSLLSIAGSLMSVRPATKRARPEPLQETLGTA